MSLKSRLHHSQCFTPISGGKLSLIDPRQTSCVAIYKVSSRHVTKAKWAFQGHHAICHIQGDRLCTDHATTPPERTGLHGLDSPLCKIILIPISTTRRNSCILGSGFCCVCTILVHHGCAPVWRTWRFFTPTRAHHSAGRAGCKRVC